jgi:hypothetical protein
MFIHVQYSEDSLFNAADPRDLAAIDVPASMRRYGEMLQERLEREFPGAEVTVEKGDDCRYSAHDNDGYYNDGTTDTVYHIANRVYEGAAWWVYRPVLAAEMIRPYIAPDWTIERAGSVCGPEDLAAFAEGYSIAESDLQGWGEYTHVIRAAQSIGGADYLAKLEADA